MTHRTYRRIAIQAEGPACACCQLQLRRPSRNGVRFGFARLVRSQMRDFVRRDLARFGW